ncbi:serglycin-like [Suncus etruscus]|uniref:serglycin-like n=1 Tax=Suncus etruscus TaxID=109475 RepID=UPI00210FC804|nr:serglycin-like [Suncus etruscus]
MQVTLPRHGRLGLALFLLLVWGASIQGSPLRKARLQWVHCNPNSNSANCIDENGPTFELPPDEFNRIFPQSPGTSLSSRQTPEPQRHLTHIRGLFWLRLLRQCSGSFDNVLQNNSEDEFCLVDDTAVFDSNFRLKRNSPSGEVDLELDAQEDFVI